MCLAQLPTGAAQPPSLPWQPRAQTAAHSLPHSRNALLLLRTSSLREGSHSNSWAPGDTVLSLRPRARGAGLEGAVGGRGPTKPHVPRTVTNTPPPLSYSARLLQSSQCFREVKRSFHSVPWPVQLTWLGFVLQTKSLSVQFPVGHMTGLWVQSRAHAGDS